MYFFYLDASALAKRYTQEIGSPVMNQLFANVSWDRLYVLSVGIAELASLLTRKKNAGALSGTEYTTALTNVLLEIVPATGPHKLAADTPLVSAAVPLISAHSINGTLVLRSALTFAVHHRANGDDLVLVASDQRLFRAAQAEGLVTFNPETQDQTALAALLGP